MFNNNPDNLGVGILLLVIFACVSFVGILILWNAIRNPAKRKITRGIAAMLMILFYIPFIIVNGPYDESGPGLREILVGIGLCIMVMGFPADPRQK